MNALLGRTKVATGGSGEKGRRLQGRRNQGSTSPSKSGLPLETRSSRRRWGNHYYCPSSPEITPQNLFQDIHIGVVHGERGQIQHSQQRSAYPRSLPARCNGCLPPCGSSKSLSRCCTIVFDGIMNYHTSL